MPDLPDQGGPLFWAAEVEAYRAAGSAPPAEAGGHGAAPHGALSLAAQALESVATLRASDAGWRSGPGDAPALAVFPPVLEGASFAIDRRVPLDPTQAAVAAGWGAISLRNGDGRFDGIAADHNSDGRAVRVWAGVKAWDRARGFWADPAWSALAPVFGGLALNWSLTESALEVPLRDASYWLERPVQPLTYGGAGGLDGGADLAGKCKPMTRGGSGSAPVLNVPPVLVDPVNRIYQYSDGAGGVVAVYEGGLAVFNNAGNVSDLYSGTTPAGQFRTDNARGLFQLGSAPVRPITCDCWGAFPAVGAVLDAANMVRHLMAADMGLPSSLLDVASFTALNTAMPYAAGFFAGTEPVDGAAAVGDLLGSLGAKLIPTRAGALRAWAPRAVPAGTAPAAAWTAAHIVRATRVSLGPPLDPPPHRLRVGYARNHAVQTSDLAPTLPETRRAWLAERLRMATWAGAANLLSFRRPSDPAPVGGALLQQAHAQAVADALGALLGTGQARLYELELPVALALRRDIGDVVRVAWPAEGLAAGRLGQVVGERIRAGDGTASLAVLF